MNSNYPEETKRENAVLIGDDKTFKCRLYYKIGSLYVVTPDENSGAVAIYVKELYIYYYDGEEKGKLITGHDELLVQYSLLANRVLLPGYGFHGGGLLKNKLRVESIAVLQNYKLNSEQNKVLRTMMAEETITNWLIKLGCKRNFKERKLSILEVKDFLAGTKKVMELMTLSK